MSCLYPAALLLLSLLLPLMQQLPIRGSDAVLVLSFFSSSFFSCCFFLASFSVSRQFRTTTMSFYRATLCVSARSLLSPGVLSVRLSVSL